MKTAHEIAEQIQHYLSMRISASADRTKGIESIIECELLELRAECERLDWLKLNVASMRVPRPGGGDNILPPTRDAIDAAMHSAQSAEETR